MSDYPTTAGTTKKPTYPDRLVMVLGTLIIGGLVLAGIGIVVINMATSIELPKIMLGAALTIAGFNALIASMLVIARGPKGL